MGVGAASAGSPSNRLASRFQVLTSVVGTWSLNSKVICVIFCFTKVQFHQFNQFFDLPVYLFTILPIYQIYRFTSLPIYELPNFLVYYSTNLPI